MKRQPIDLATHLDAATGEVESGRWPGGVVVLRPELLPRVGLFENHLSPLEVEAALAKPFSLSVLNSKALFSLKRLTSRPRVALPTAKDLFAYAKARVGSNSIDTKVLGWTPSRGWRDASGAAEIGIDPLPGLLFGLRYLWSARLLCGRGHLVLPVGPHEALDIFRNRDAFGSNRRAALLHWVSSHERHMESGTVAEVRAHLRGKRTFVWNGWQCTLNESDAEKDGGQ